MHVNDEFGHWLAGFLAGEGCFQIQHRPKLAVYSCCLTVQLRDDDREILEEIRETTGLGYLSSTKAYKTSNPQVRWTVSKKSDCIELMYLLDRFPLRARKQRDYAIWRDAVLYWMRFGKNQQRDWTPMAQYRTQLQAARAYVESSP